MIGPGVPDLVVFAGGLGPSPQERMVAGARLAAALDALEAALASEAYNTATLLTDEPPPPSLDVPQRVRVIADKGPFHFGERLREMARLRQNRPLVYFGAGSMALLDSASFRQIAALLEEDGVVTNNFYSADLVGVRPALALALLDAAFDSDNPLPRLLRDATELPVHTLDRTCETQFDVDSPADLVVLAATGLGGPRLRRYVAGLPLDAGPLRRAMPLFTDKRAEVFVAGRVGSHVWQQIERDTACRVRLLAEERGMQADGREAAGGVRSVLGMYLASVGEERFFGSLAELGDATFLDYRVLMAHICGDGPPPSRADRFAADLGAASAIGHPLLRRFVEAAARAPRPVILGGHSLVSGGLMAVIRAAWEEHDRRA